MDIDSFAASALKITHSRHGYTLYFRRYQIQCAWCLLVASSLRARLVALRRQYGVPDLSDGKGSSFAGAGTAFHAVPCPVGYSQKAKKENPG